MKRSTATKPKYPDKSQQRGNIHPAGMRAALFPLETAAVSISREVIVFPPRAGWTQAVAALTREKWECDPQSGAAGSSRAAAWLLTPSQSCLESLPRLSASGQPRVQQDLWLALGITNSPEFWHCRRTVPAERQDTPALAVCCCPTSPGPHHCWLQGWAKAGGQILQSPPQVTSQEHARTGVNTE